MHQTQTQTQTRALGDHHQHADGKDTDVEGEKDRRGLRALGLFCPKQSLETGARRKSGGGRELEGVVVGRWPAALTPLLPAFCLADARLSALACA